MTDIRETWYRFEDRRYSNADEYGDHAYTTYEVALLTYVVAKYTPKGVWLQQYYGPNPPTGNLNNYIGYRRFVLKDATKRFACATIEEALASYVARKTKQAAIYRARAEEAAKFVLLAHYKVRKMNIPGLEIPT